MWILRFGKVKQQVPGGIVVKWKVGLNLMSADFNVFDFNPANPVNAAWRWRAQQGKGAATGGQKGKRWVIHTLDVISAHSRK